MRKLVSILFLGLCLLKGAVVHAQTKEELEKQRQQIQQEIEDLKRSQSEVKKNKKESLGQLARIQSLIRKRDAVIETINKQMRLIDDDIFLNNREIYRLQKELDTLKAQYAKTVEYAYKNRSNYDMLNFIFSAVSFNDAIKRIAYLKSYREYRETQVQNINNTQVLLAQKNQSLATNKTLKSKTLVEQSQQMKKLEEEKKEKDAVVTQLKSKENELEKQLTAKRKMDANLKNAITAILRRIAAEEAAKARELKANAAKNNTNASANSRNASDPAKSKRSTSAYESTPESVRLSENFENNRGKLPWPVDKGLVTGEFGRKKIEGTSLYEDNIGVTIQTNVGQPVKAVFGGTVTKVYDIGGNWAITLRHGKYLTTYNNLSSVSANVGQQVDTGQMLGKAGENLEGDGEITFIVNNEMKFVDPLTWLKRK